MNTTLEKRSSCLIPVVFSRNEKLSPKDENTSLDMKVKINLDLLPYIYPKRKSIDMNSNDMPEVKIYINHEEVGVESKEHF